MADLDRMRDDKNLDPVVRDIMFPEQKRTTPAGNAGVAAPERGASEREGPEGLPEDGMAVPRDVAAAVLANAMNGPQPDSTHLPDLIPNYFVEREVPYERLHVMIDSIRALGLIGDDSQPPPDQTLYICGVPEGAFVNMEVSPAAPTPLLAAVAESLRDPKLMGLLREAIVVVREGVADSNRFRARQSHSITFEGEAREHLVLLRRPPPHLPVVRVWDEVDANGVLAPLYGVLREAEGRCSCGFRTARNENGIVTPGPTNSYLALEQCAAHVRLDIEMCLRELGEETARATMDR